eukprot:5841014-Alexandrium_andersonii.AAC.1
MDNANPLNRVSARTSRLVLCKIFIIPTRKQITYLPIGQTIAGYAFHKVKGPMVKDHTLVYM